jgi:hypothetical protein
MIFCEFNDQVDEYGRIEVVIRNLVYSTEPRAYLPIYDFNEFMRFISEEAYWPDFVKKIPSWLEPICGYPDSLKHYVKKRVFKKWAKKIFNLYGEADRVEKIHNDFESWLDSINDETDFELIGDFKYI